MLFKRDYKWNAVWNSRVFRLNLLRCKEVKCLFFGSDSSTDIQNVTGSHKNTLLSCEAWKYQCHWFNLQQVILQTHIININTHLVASDVYLKGTLLVIVLYSNMCKNVCIKWRISNRFPNPGPPVIVLFTVSQQILQQQTWSVVSPQILSAGSGGSGGSKQGSRRHFYIPVLSCSVQSGCPSFVQFILRLTCIRHDFNVDELV